MKKKNQNKTKITDNIYNSRNRHAMEMEKVPFSYNDHLADYMKRNGRIGSDRVRAMNNSIAMDEAYQESKGITEGVSKSRFGTLGTTATATARKNAPKTTPSVTDELTDSVKRGVDKTFNKFTTVAGGYLGSKFASWSWKHMVAAGTATTAALTVGLYSGYKKQEDE